MPPTDPTAALRTALGQAIWEANAAALPDTTYWHDQMRDRADDLMATRAWTTVLAALATSQADDPSDGESLTPDEASATSRALYQRGWDAGQAALLAFQDDDARKADDPSGPDREDALLLADAILGGTSYLPHREAAERVKAALRESPDGE